MQPEGSSSGRMQPLGEATHNNLCKTLSHLLVRGSSVEPTRVIDSARATVKGYRQLLNIAIFDDAEHAHSCGLVTYSVLWPCHVLCPVALSRTLVSSLITPEEVQRGHCAPLYQTRNGSGR